MKLVDSRPEFERASAALAGARTLFVDTEFESTRDGTLLCLLQLSRGDEIFLVDALRLADLSALGPILGAENVEWVLHASQQDVPLITNRLALTAPPRIFDTQVAWALLGPEHSVSLPYLVYRVLGVRTGKSHQADDWVRRPLPPAQLAYAAGDIEHLPGLHRELSARADALGRRHAIEQASAELLWPAAEAPSELSLASFRNAWQLDRQGQAALRFIVKWHNALDPRARAMAPEPKTLLAIAGRLPATPAELSRIKGVSKRFAAEHGQRFIHDLKGAMASADAADFVEIDPPPYATFDDVRLEGWLAHARAEISAELGVAPELAFPGRVLKRMKGEIERSGERASGARALTGWRSSLLAEPYLAFSRQKK